MNRDYPEMTVGEFGALGGKPRIVSADTTLDVLDTLVQIDVSSGPITITIPTGIVTQNGRKSPGFMHTAGDLSLNNCTIVDESGALIRGASEYVFKINGTKDGFDSDGTNWI